MKFILSQVHGAVMSLLPDIYPPSRAVREVVNHEVAMWTQAAALHQMIAQNKGTETIDFRNGLETFINTFGRPLPEMKLKDM